MERVQAATLIMVNWNGIFYQEFELSDGVTTLFGGNGAGKTTVMIAAYMILMPEKRKLAFINDEDKARKGIYGRLGKKNSPVYAALEYINIDGTRGLVGVKIDIKDHTSDYDIKPFTITGLPDDRKLVDIFLNQHGNLSQVNSSTEFANSTAVQGATLQVYTSITKYLTDIYKIGILPINVADETNRRKYNDLLRSCLKGDPKGDASQANVLGNNLKNFLFEQKTTASDALERMRTCIIECRKTRSQLNEWEELKREITNIYTRGEQLLYNSYCAGQLVVREVKDEIAKATAHYTKIDAELKYKKEEEVQTENRYKDVESRLSSQNEYVETLTQTLERTKEANRVYNELDEKNKSYQEENAAFEVLEQEYNLIVDEYNRLSGEVTICKDNFDNANQCLINQQAGLDAINEKLRKYKIATSNLKIAVDLLNIPSIEADEVEKYLNDINAELTTVDKDVIYLNSKINEANKNKDSFEKVKTALNDILENGLDPDILNSDLKHLAEARLDELHLVDQEVFNIPTLLELHKELKKKVELQKQIFDSIDSYNNTFQANIERSRDSFESTLRAVRARKEETTLTLANTNREKIACKNTIKELEEKISKLKLEIPLWNRDHARAKRFFERLNRSDWEPSKEYFLSLITTIQTDSRNLQEELRNLEEYNIEVEGQISELKSSGGNFSKELLNAVSFVNGTLLAKDFDDVNIEAAAYVQAKLGPLVNAIYVEDVTVAVERLVQLETRPETIWLVDSDMNLEVVSNLKDELDSSDELPTHDSIFVESSVGARLTKLPKRPTIGAKARKQEIDRLQNIFDENVRRINDLYHIIEEHKSWEGEAKYLFGVVERLAEPDPNQLLIYIEEEKEELDLKYEEFESIIDELNIQLNLSSSQEKHLSDVYRLVDLLEEPELSTSLEEMTLKLELLTKKKSYIESIAKSREYVRQNLNILLHPPLTEEELEELILKYQATSARKEILDGAIYHLNQVFENIEALGWSNLQAQYEKDAEIKEMLVSQLEKAKELLDIATSKKEAVHLQYTDIRDQYNKTKGALAEKYKEINRLQEKLDAYSDVDASNEALSKLVKEYQEAHKLQLELVQQTSEYRITLKNIREDIDDLIPKVDEALHARDFAIKSAKPQEEIWELYNKQLEESEVQSTIYLLQGKAEYEATNSRDYFNRAWNILTSLKTYVNSAKNNTDISINIDALEQKRELEGTTSRLLQAYLNIFISIRKWLNSRVPKEVSQSSDPTQKLSDTNTSIRRLSESLERYENSLQHDAYGIHNEISGELRKARKRIQEINRILVNLQFGSVGGIEIKFDREEHFSRFLESLAKKENQLKLLGTDVSLEQGLNELYSSVVGGTRKLGNRLLDYREYIVLEPKVQARGGNGEWRSVLAVSGGEALCVSAAIMMSALTIWDSERFFNRKNAPNNNLQLIFMDEVGRLDSANMENLFALCRKLGLQVIVAAPHKTVEVEGLISYQLERRFVGNQQRVYVEGIRHV